MRGVRGFYRDDLFPNKEIYIGHVALYLGENKVIHAKKTAEKVVMQDLNEVVSNTKYRIILIKRY